MAARQRHTLSVSVFVIVERQGCVLLLRRSGTGWHDGDFSLPAGALEANETPHAAAVRELAEETGLQAHPSDVALVHTLYCTHGDNGQAWLGLFFRVSAICGEPRLAEPDKHDALRWYPVDALPQNIVPYTLQGLEGARIGRIYSTFPNI